MGDQRGLHQRPGPPACRWGPEKSGCTHSIDGLAVDGEALGRSRGGPTGKLHVAVDAAGLPVAVTLTPGQAGDNPELLGLIDAVADL